MELITTRAKLNGGTSSLSQEDILKFGQDTLSQIFGKSLKSEVFLAGGTFKTLLHGKLPKDFDLWVSNKTEREIVIEQLINRGAVCLQDWPPYNTSFQLGEMRIELAYGESYESLEQCIAQFDLVLSSIGVSWNPRNEWDLFIHPFFFQSIQKQQIFLAKPLVNWKYALTTLERAKRYAKELNYQFPKSEEDGIWKIFQSQSKDEQRKMIDRYQKIGGEKESILKQANLFLQSTP